MTLDDLESHLGCFNLLKSHTSENAKFSPRSRKLAICVYLVKHGQKINSLRAVNSCLLIQWQ